MFERLEKYDDKLKGISLVLGLGLTSNIYVIGNDEITLIDVGNGAKENRFESEFVSLKLKYSDVAQIIITHPHFDHVGGLVEIVKEVKPKIFVYQDDTPLIVGIVGKRVIGLKDGDILDTEGYRLRVIHTPGHTIGSICLYDEEKKILFSGDTVFSNGYFGRCDLATGSIHSMVESLRKLADLNVDILLPGHEDLVFRKADKHISSSLKTAKRFL